MNLYAWNEGLGGLADGLNGIGATIQKARDAKAKAAQAQVENNLKAAQTRKANADASAAEWAQAPSSVDFKMAGRPDPAMDVPPSQPAPDGQAGPPPATPRFLTNKEADAWSAQRAKDAAVAAGRKKAEAGKMGAKDLDDIKAMAQGLTNLKQVEQQWKQWKGSDNSWNQRLANMPLIGSAITSDPAFQNKNPGWVNIDRAIHEAANAYTRGTFGRVSNELVHSSRELFPKQGTSVDNARNSLNELANTLKGKANGIITAAKARGDYEGAAKMEQELTNAFGDYRFFNELDDPASQTPPAAKTNFRPPALDPQMKALAQKAMADPNASPAHKAAAQKLLSGQ